jgi:hypothetical protein
MNGFQSLPVTHNVLANWIAFELESNKITTVKQYVSALRSKHIDRGLPVTVFTELSITRIFTGARRLHGTPPIRERREITKDILLQMLTHIEISSFNGLNIYAAFCVAFAGFLRPGELTWDKWDHTESHASHICRQSVNFTADGVVIHLPKSKTDQFGKGTDLTLSYSNDAACPVHALRRLFDRYPRPLTDPLFARVLGPFNKRWFAENIQSSLLKAGVANPSKYSGHSFRRGAANTAISAGLSLDDVKALGRWKSDAAKLYLTEKSSNTINFAINKRLHQQHSIIHLAPPRQESPLISGPANAVPRDLSSPV